MLRYLFILLFSCSILTAADKPNILLIVADDLGWADVSSHGGKTPTPNIDGLLKNGRELTNFMVSPVCSPTRAGLLTGYHPLRSDNGPQTDGTLPTGMTTLPEVLKQHNYATGAFGKWHNGMPTADEAFMAKSTWFKKGGKPGVGVNVHGFDRFAGFYGGGCDQFSQVHNWHDIPVWFEDEKWSPDSHGYTDEMVTKEAIRFMAESKKKGQPFLCYVPFALVHSPYQAREDLLKNVSSDIKDPKQRIYSAMISALDQYVGSLISSVNELGVADNTIIIFFSDNGGTPMANNAPLRGGKHSIYEGGIHVAASILYPKGKIMEGKYDGMLGYLDIMPTLLSLCDIPLPKECAIDGKDCSAAIFNKSVSPVQSYTWLWRNQDMIRTGEWKLFRGKDGVELYNLKSDIGESKDVSKDHPEVVASLLTQLNESMKDIGYNGSHLPLARSSALDKADPKGDILEFVIDAKTVKAPAKPTEVVFANRGRSDYDVRHDDVLEFDMMVAKDSDVNGFSYSCYAGNSAGLGGGKGVDQYGNYIPAGKHSATGVWTRHRIGVGTLTPGTISRHVIKLANKGGHFHFFIDNLRVVRSDGTVLPIWMDGKDLKKSIVNPESADVKVSVVAFIQK